MSSGKRLKAVCKGSQITFTLDEASQGSLGVKLTLGSDLRYCVLFGGKILTDTQDLFKAKDAPAPETCP